MSSGTVQVVWHCASPSVICTPPLIIWHCANPLQSSNVQTLLSPLMRHCTSHLALCKPLCRLTPYTFSGTVQTTLSSDGVLTPLSPGTVQTPLSSDTVQVTWHCGNPSVIWHCTSHLALWKPLCHLTLYKSPGTVETPLSSDSVLTSLSPGTVQTPLSSGTVLELYKRPYHIAISLQTAFSSGTVQTNFSSGAVQTTLSSGTVQTASSSSTVQTGLCIWHCTETVRQIKTNASPTLWPGQFAPLSAERLLSAHALMAIALEACL